MPTPASGAISMDNMRDEITRGTGAVSMSEIRTRYGGSGAISFSDLYASEGFTVTCDRYVNKYFSFDGWHNSFATGSVSPNEGGGLIQFAANSYLYQMNSTAGTGADGLGALSSNGVGGSTTGITAGYQGTDVTRVVTANVSRTLDTWATSSTAAFYFGYDFPESGTIHCLIKF